MRVIRLSGQPHTKNSRTDLVSNRQDLGRIDQDLQFGDTEVTNTNTPAKEGQASSLRGTGTSKHTHFTRPFALSFSIFAHAVGMSGWARRG